MPRRQSLQLIRPNRFYEIDATLKYQHVGENNITGIIQQNNIQTKIMIPKDGIQLQEGKKYVFGKCFNSRNGWLYARNPSQTVTQQNNQSVNSESIQNLLSLKQICENKQALINHYVSAQMKIISLQPKQTLQKNNQNLFLYKLKCFSQNLMIDIQIWNQQINQREVKGKVLNFIGFKIKSQTHQTFSLVSTVYSKIQQPQKQKINSEKFNYYTNVLYRNLSNIYEVRTIQQIHKICEQIHKNYSLSLASVNYFQQFQYEGCDKCKKKLGQNGCFQCGSNINKTVYKYLRVILQDESGMIQCALFDQQCQQITIKLFASGKAIFKIKSSAKRNHQNNQVYLSHVITQIRQLINSQ